ncbi:hypothetical protein AAFC00_002244 [Neodothiora populina]|uniref:F-box domain-containing protein n=1 Tax=Neodothiora populina TaxID=2781224 RepID=A0ABR3PH18_9PEZI
MTDLEPLPAFLALPPEIRNNIYDLLFVTPSPYSPLIPSHSTRGSRSNSLLTFGRESPLDQAAVFVTTKNLCGLLQTCKSLNAEANFLYLSRTRFSLPGHYASPEYFSRAVRPLSTCQVQHIRHITLTGRINNMRAMNESWNGTPFDNPNLHLETLTIIPRRPQNHESNYAEIADLSQSHTLAYILCETLKGLKSVDRIIVRNDEACFSDAVWKLVYKSLVWKMFRWAGRDVGLKFRQDARGEVWFEILNGTHGKRSDGWRDAHEEVSRLIER